MDEHTDTVGDHTPCHGKVQSLCYSKTWSHHRGIRSALGFIVGSQVASAFGSWRWALRVSPPLGVACIILFLIFVKEPPRGAADGAKGDKSMLFRKRGRS